MHSGFMNTSTFLGKTFARIISIGFLLTVSAIPHLVIAQETTLPSGNELYSEAISAMRQLPMPHYIDYDDSGVVDGLDITIACNSQSHAYIGSTVTLKPIKYSSPTQHIRYDSVTSSGTLLSKDGKQLIQCIPFPFAPEVRALVHTGAGDSLSATPTQKPVANNAGPIDLLGVIARITTFSSRYYNVTNAGIVSMNGVPSYHLQMQARDGDESSHPLTDMYVDTKTHLVRAVVLGGGKRGFIMGGGGYGQFNFGGVGKYWLVTSINVSVAGHMLFLHQSGSQTFTFSNFTFPDGPSK